MATTKGNNTCSCCCTKVFSKVSGIYSPKQAEKDDTPPPIPKKTGKRLHLSTFGCGTSYELDKEFEKSLTLPSRTGKVVSLVSFDIPKYNLKDEGGNSSKPSASGNNNEGTIVNNFYANNYYGSIDATGTAVGTGGSPESTLGSLVNSVGSLAGTLLMDQDTEETTNISDRLLTEKVSNSAINTQSAVGRLLAYSHPDSGDSPVSCSDEPTKAQPGNERFYTVNLATWTTTQKTYDIVTFTPSLELSSTLSLYASTQKQHFLEKCGWKVQVQCNTSQFHTGSLLVFMAPEFPKFHMNSDGDASTNLTKIGTDYINWTTLPELDWFRKKDTGNDSEVRADWYATTPEQWTLYPHQILNCRTGTSVSIEVPYVGVTPTSHRPQHNGWTLVVCVLTPLQYSSGAATAIQITASFAPVNPTWNGLRHMAFSQQGPVPVTVRENHGQFLSTLPDKSVPTYGRAKGPKDYLPGEITDLVQIGQIPTMVSYAPTGSTEKVPYFEVGASNSSGTQLFKANVILTDAILLRTAAAATALNFTQYSGSTVYTFMFAGSAMHKVKFLIAYTPPGAGEPTTMDDANQGTYAVWDVGLNSTFKFTIPFISPSEKRFTFNGNATELDVDGWLTVYQLTPLTFPSNCPTTAKVVVMFSFGPDFSLHNPLVPMLNQGTTNAEEGAPEVQGAGVDFTAHDVPTPNLSQSNVGFFYDRSMFAGSLVPANLFTTTLSLNPKNMLLLTPHFSFNLEQKLYRMATSWDKYTNYCYSFLAACPFTYYKADLEVTVIPMYESNGPYQIFWFPSGSHIPTNATKLLDGHAIYSGIFSSQPVATNVGYNASSFTIPFTSPLSYLTVDYDGRNAFKNGTYGVCPGNNWGAIVVAAAEGNTENKRFAVYYRFKNMRAFLPRPYRMTLRTLNNRLRPTTTEGYAPPHRRERFDAHPRIMELDSYVRSSDEEEDDFQDMEDHTDILLGGDIEENPGPDSLVEAAVKDLIDEVSNLPPEEAKGIKKTLQGIKETASKTLKKLKPKEKKKEQQTEEENALLAFLEAEDPIETMAKGWSAIAEVQRLWASIKRVLNDTSFWYDLFVTILKYIISTMIWILNPTTSVTLGLAAMAALDFLSMKGLKTKILDFLTPRLGPPPDIPDGLFQEPPTPLTRTKNFFGIFSEDETSKLHDEAGEGFTKRVQDANHTFNFCKNLEWLTNTITKLITWIASWFKKPEATKQQVLEEKMKLFAAAVDDIQSYRSGESNTFPETSVAVIKEIFTLASETGKTGLANLASKFMITRTNNTPRMEPVVVVLRGKPGTGKSVASHILAQAISKQMIGQQSVYSFPPDCDHLDGYSGQYAVVMDDLGQNPDGEDFSTFCQMVSTTNYIPPMANLDDKGRPFCSSVIIATTNLSAFAPVTVADPMAVERRIFLDLEVTPGVTCQINGKLDLEAALEPIGPAVGPFRQDCELLHTAGLCFTDRRTRQQYSLYEVFQLVEERIKVKSTVKKNLMALVFEAPGEPPSFEDFLLQMNLATRERDIIIQEMRELKQGIEENKKLQLEFYSLVLVLGGIAGLMYGVYKATTAVCNYLMPDTPPKEEDETQPERAPFLEPAQAQGAYDGKATKKPVVTKKLQLQGPGNPDFERHLACHAVVAIHFFPPNTQQPVSQSAILLFGRCFMVNSHTWNKDWTKFELRGVEYTKDECDWLDLYKEGISTDATVVQLPKGQMFKDNLSKFMTKDLPFPQKNTPVTCVNCSNGTLFYSGHIIRAPQTCEIIRGLSSSMFIYQAQTYPGYCGSAVVATVKGRKLILGMHSAGNSGTAGAIFVTQEDLRQVRDYFAKNSAPPPPEPLSDEGLLTELPDGPLIHVPRKTKLRKSPAFPIFQPSAGPAVLSKNDSRLNPEVDFDKQVFSKHSANQKVYPEAFRRMARWYANEVFTHIGKDNGPLSLKDAIKGIDFLDAMDPTTSPGLPYSAAGVQRTDLVDFDTGEIISAALAVEYNNYVEGNYEDHIFQTFLKDEIRSEEKIHAGKTRIVDVPSLAHVIMGRVLLGRFCSKFQASPGTTLGSAIGCNPDTDWTKFAHELMERRWCYDIDYSNFDSTHGTGMFELLIECFFTKENGFSPAVAPYLRSLATSKHAWMNKRYLIEGGLPSGCSATSVLNTVMNNIIIRALLSLTYSNFHPEDVAVLAYGDDLLVASDFVLDFNRVRATANEHTLYKLTTANKAPDFPETSTLLECQFLKRKFVLHSVRNFIWRPVMDKTNLQTMLSFYKPNTLSEKLLSVAQLAFHSGYHTYEELFEPFRELQMKVPSWFVLEHEWEHNFD